VTGQWTKPFRLSKPSERVGRLPRPVGQQRGFRKSQISACTPSVIARLSLPTRSPSIGVLGSRAAIMSRQRFCQFGCISLSPLHDPRPAHRQPNCVGYLFGLRASVTLQDQRGRRSPSVGVSADDDQIYSGFSWRLYRDYLCIGAPQAFLRTKKPSTSRSR
jgi:hypothetical protein